MLLFIYFLNYTIIRWHTLPSCTNIKIYRETSISQTKIAYIKFLHTSFYSFDFDLLVFQKNCYSGHKSTGSFHIYRRTMKLYYTNVFRCKTQKNKKYTHAFLGVLLYETQKYTYKSINTPTIVFSNLVQLPSQDKTYSQI